MFVDLGELSFFKLHVAAVSISQTQRQQDFSRELQPEIVHTFTFAVTDDARPDGELQSLDQPEASSSFQTSQMTEQATAVPVSGLKESPEIRLIPSATDISSPKPSAHQETNSDNKRKSVHF